MRKASSWLIALTAALALSAPARAEKVIHEFTGTVTEVQPGGLLPFSVKAGDTFTGTFSYDGGMRAGAPGFHALQLGSLDVIVNGVNKFSFAFPQGFVVVGDNVVTGGVPRDHFFAQMNANGAFRFTEHGLLTYSGIISLTAEKDLGALTSNKLQGLQIDLSKFDQKVLELAGGDTAGSGFWRIRGEFTSMSKGDTPEPTSLALLAMGGAGLAAYRWRRRH